MLNATLEAHDSALRVERMHFCQCLILCRFCELCNICDKLRSACMICTFHLSSFMEIHYSKCLL